MIRVSPLVRLINRGFTAGQAALKAVSCKVPKHEKACIENQHVFIPFAFDTFGFFAPEAVELLSRVQRVMHNNIMKPRSTDAVFKNDEIFNGDGDGGGEYGGDGGDGGYGGDGGDGGWRLKSDDVEEGSVWFYV
nr:auxilin-like protein [Tanacetum cinerariifolium]